MKLTHVWMNIQGLQKQIGNPSTVMGDQETTTPHLDTYFYASWESQARVVGAHHTIIIMTWSLWWEAFDTALPKHSYDDTHMQSCTSVDE